MFPCNPPTFNLIKLYFSGTSSTSSLFDTPNHSISQEFESESAKDNAG